MIRALLSFCLFCLTNVSFAQNGNSKTLHIGIEQDVLPYLTGGYFAGVWAGKNHLRVRAITAKVNKPDFIIKNGFTNNNVKAYAMIVDYFLKQDWKGWWVGSGFVYWKSTIQTDKKLSTAEYHNYLLNGSIGYSFTLSKHLYVSPWSALHLRIAGNKKVPVDDKKFESPFINPEASIKLGVWF